jgi:rhodanese-related sulfurtransferase
MVDEFGLATEPLLRLAAIVVCQKGAKLSEGAAAWLRHAGIPADSLEGGIEGWRKAGLPLVNTA